MNNKQKYKTDVKTLFEALPHGGLSEVARRSNLSVKAVQDVRDGVFRNEKVVETAITYLEQYSAERKRHEDRVSSFVQALPALMKEPANSVAS